ncbi:MAG: DUF934 domain-containing protein [Methylococcales bacterium]|nr:DUF934 domain-containing protein [Methylococcales bacterium]
MQIIKNKQLLAGDNWSFAADDSEIGDSGDITVSIERWKAAKHALLQRAGKTGLRLRPADDVAVLDGDLDGVELIELDFSGFGDGRPFSQARLLRSRLAYQGEIRAVGNYLPDQVYYLIRVGVNAFRLENEAQIPLVLSCMDDFSVNYQASSI